MQPESTHNPPGPKWLLLGAAGFAAGFFGPLIFVPDANQGPLVGILITGPLGVLLGALLWGLCTLLHLSARAQWRTLYAVGVGGVLTTLLSVQPEPKVQGYVFEGSVESCMTPLEAEANVLAYWNKRIAEVNWAEPRADWQADIHELLREAPGVVVSVRVRRQNPIKETRKPWNRGSQFAAGWTAHEDVTSFHAADETCDRFQPGSAIRGYQPSDYEDRIVAVDIWPPPELLRVLRASPLEEVPERWRHL